jgi:DnaJ-class molecular chaperone
MKILWIGKKEEDCHPHEIICHVCKGSTVGDYGQPFECEPCMGTGSISFFEVNIN